MELVHFTEPEKSAEALEQILSDAEDILQAFNLHYKVVTLCTSDLSLPSACDLGV